ncbi:glutamine cyclotransferase [Sphingomonas panacis]|uniref:Glutamine cyclotransferase n=1 Tax=Sphingomonas panacis TaxID=1560345 RepID=A0A1B3ZFE9_9SPHN|nr:glutaminyl-peptide cyclotransferase [Sphingomonas panacis]AOH86157.1 glutamine cyclotransferase [Sphingomonas panacis]
MRSLGFFALLLVVVAPAAADPLPLEPAKVIATFPHDTGAYTEGLFYRDGSLFESTGMEGRSTIRQVDLKTGTVRRKVSIPPSEFGEGIVDWGDQIVSLTWKGGHGYRWTLGGFKRVGTFRYPGEGWALTKDAHHIIMSDGTPVLRLLDPKTLRIVKRVTVTADGNPVENINELEFVDGEILANIWMTDLIARIDPTSGHVLGWIDVSALTKQANAGGGDAVANGIAWDAKARRLFVTGKEWPVLFEIAPPHTR